MELGLKAYNWRIDENMQWFQRAFRRNLWGNPRKLEILRNPTESFMNGKMENRRR